MDRKFVKDIIYCTIGAVIICSAVGAYLHRENENTYEKGDSVKTQHTEKRNQEKSIENLINR